MMTLMGACGYYMLELTQIKGGRNENLRIKIPVIVATHAIVFFLFGIGFALNSSGGFFGTSYIFGHLPYKG